MNQILIGLWIPVIDEIYDVNVPNSIVITELVALLAKAVEELSGNHYVSSGQEFLCRMSTKQVLDGHAKLADYCIKNGEKIALL